MPLLGTLGDSGGVLGTFGVGVVLHTRLRRVSPFFRSPSPTLKFSQTHAHVSVRTKCHIYASRDHIQSVLSDHWVSDPEVGALSFRPALAPVTLDQLARHVALVLRSKLNLPIDFTGRSEELLVILISVDRDRLEIVPRSEIRLRS